MGRGVLSQQPRNERTGRATVASSSPVARRATPGEAFAPPGQILNSVSVVEIGQKLEFVCLVLIVVDK